MRWCRLASRRRRPRPQTLIAEIRDDRRRRCRRPRALRARRRRVARRARGARRSASTPIAKAISRWPTRPARVEAVEAALAGLGDPEARQSGRRRRGRRRSAGCPPRRSRRSARPPSTARWATGPMRSSPTASRRSTMRQPRSSPRASAASRSWSGTAAPIEAPAREMASGWGADALVDRARPQRRPATRAPAARRRRPRRGMVGWHGASWSATLSVRAVTPEGDLISIDGMRLADADGAGHAALEAARVALRDGRD